MINVFKKWSIFRGGRPGKGLWKGNQLVLTLSIVHERLEAFCRLKTLRLVGFCSQNMYAEHNKM